MPDLAKNYRKKSYTKCDKSKDLITPKYDHTQRSHSLHLNEVNITCCYKQILRWGTDTKADNQFHLQPCSNFHQDFVVPQRVDGIITECRRLTDKKLLQKDAFGFVQPKGQLMNNSFANDSLESESFESRPSVLLWGIDSMSRMNFERTMPLMFKYLREENWFELRGYNKIDDNTFPNLMAVLTGYNLTRSMSVCRPNDVGGLDDCPFQWKSFKAQGYVTAYAEDWSEYSTFNFNFKGFHKPPTDYYARPLILAVERELPKINDMNIPYCVGRRHFAEYIYDAAIQFTEVYRNQSTFGMFWTNSFSHNNFMLPSSMDTRMLEYMRTLSESGVLEKSIVIFFSDHGMRFGQLRALKTGFLEERMPIMYISLPRWFKNKYPEFVHSLQLNQNRLTSPYDIYATLKHILQLDTPLNDLPRPEGCPRCHSLFHEVTETRDCREAGIADFWCTCQELGEISKSEPKARMMAEQLVEATNNYLSDKKLSDICQKLQLNKIELVQRQMVQGSNESEFYVVRYETKQAWAIFEAWAQWNNATQKISTSVTRISRLTSYRQHSGCVRDAVAKKYCICRTK
ncbi:GH17275 [Drosophila grimshawi]|uniref:GH17275 n=2 Tax=Drosophila grimshawi TaxID=7222 RepID=B4JUE8_DROGR|nr:GH17275 [Drosophila grimshawi]